MYLRSNETKHTNERTNARDARYEARASFAPFGSDLSEVRSSSTLVRSFSRILRCGPTRFASFEDRVFTFVRRRAKVSCSFRSSVKGSSFYDARGRIRETSVGITSPFPRFLRSPLDLARAGDSEPARRNDATSRGERASLVSAARYVFRWRKTSELRQETRSESWRMEREHRTLQLQDARRRCRRETLRVVLTACARGRRVTRGDDARASKGNESVAFDFSFYSLSVCRRKIDGAKNVLPDRSETNLWTNENRRTRESTCLRTRRE